MKKITSLIVAALLIAIFIFAVTYWLFNFSYSESINIALSAAVAGFVVALLEPYFTKKAKEQEQSIAERVRRGLNRTYRNNK